MDAVAPALGFAAYYGQEDFPEHEGDDGFPPKFGWDDDTLQFALDRLDEFERPFVATLVTGTMHSPYADPGSRFHVVPHASQGESGYVNTLHYSDWALGRFFDRARESAWFANTFFLVCADHAWKGSAGDNLRAEFQIPSFLLGPGIPPGRMADVRSQLDCLPWILEVLGFSDPFSALGRGLLSDEPTHAVVNKGLVMGILSERGCLQHSLDARIGAYSFAGARIPRTSTPWSASCSRRVAWRASSSPRTIGPRRADGGGAGVRPSDPGDLGAERPELRRRVPAPHGSM